ncbi:MAG: OmpH family outer membrane protein [Verrucomicrobiales bacterium]|nr:OmpH family outer membrane protein [Verrucomicrobiales bacterium]
MKCIVLLLAVLTLGSSSVVFGQNLNIAVIDMQQALKDYYRTSEEVEKINALGEEKIRNIDERKAVYEKMTSDMVKLDKQARASELSDEKKREIYAQLQEAARARNAKANEIGDAERKASQQLYDARQQMELALMEEIKLVVQQVVTQKGVDMVFDKSYLPKASKVILYTSPKVTDLTNEVIARLNSNRR